MLAGISTACFYPEHTEDVLKRLCALPIQCVEIFVNCGRETTPAYTGELRRIADGSGVEVTSLHPYTSGFEPLYFFTSYDRRFQEGRDLYKRHYEAAANLGAKYVVFHGGSKGVDIQQCNYFERYAILMADAKAGGVELCHENVSRCVGYSPSFFKALLDTIPDAGIVFDLKQAIRSGQDILPFARLLGSNIRHIHFSDHDNARDCLTPGHGTFNIPEFLHVIANLGFDGSLIVELYRENFDGLVDIFSGYQLLLRNISTYT